MPKCVVCRRRRQVGPLVILGRELKGTQCGRGYSLGYEGMYEHGCGGELLGIELYEGWPGRKREPWR